MLRSVLAGALTASGLFAAYMFQTPSPLLLSLAGTIWMWNGLSRGRSQSVPTTAPVAEAAGVPTTSFADIAGQDQAKRELQEAVALLKPGAPSRAYGIRPLKGILLTGLPGTGKTMLAKAVANSTDACFLAASGSQFVEKYVGVGAGRVRQLFQAARQLGQQEGNCAVIFIDEIDAMGTERSQGQQREYDQTLNQLLTEMDGIDGDKGGRILVIAATNRKEMLDSALLRPGRFDRHVAVQLPDAQAREEILQLYVKGKPVDASVDIRSVARETFGFSGAQLESLVNEAAIYALRAETPEIMAEHFTMAVDKVMMGEVTNRSALGAEKRRVAVHELGHALVAEKLFPGSVSQVSLQARNGALGYVRHRPEADRYLFTAEDLHKRLQVILAGPAAEKIIYGQTSTGSKGDYSQACQVAREMVEAGWSELGIVDPRLLKEEALHAVVREILQQAFVDTMEQVGTLRDSLQEILPLLLQEESLDGERLRHQLLQPAS